MPVSKRTRFEVFKRDLFVCQYCGSKPPAVVLEVDHVHPVSKGGTDSKENLLTSCWDCNRGKADKLLSSLPQSVSEQSELLTEKLAQVKAFHRLQKSIRKHEDDCIAMVEHEFIQSFPDQQFTHNFRESCRIFVQKLDAYDLVGYMARSCHKMNSAHAVIKYFCGICWRVIKERDNG